MEPRLSLTRKIDNKCSYVPMRCQPLPRGLLSTPVGIDYEVIGFDMEVQPLVTHNAA